MNNPSVPESIRILENDLLEAKDLLRSGLDASLAQLAGASEQTGKLMTGEVRAKLRGLELMGEKAIDEVERQVGVLNYLSAEGDITDIEAFDRMAEPLSESIHAARLALKKLDEKGHRELGDLSGQLGTAWRNLHLYIEIVRLELALAESGTREGCAELRASLVEEFASAAADAKRAVKEHDATTITGRLFEGIRKQVKGVSKTFRMLLSAYENR